MAKNKNRKQGGPEQRGATEQTQRGAERSAPPGEQNDAAPSPAQFASGGKRRKKFGHN
ncbi:hypothetical protein G5C60_26650 [Streptomyces sp. HC44]|uniref:Uncharacterized protein n=1 Tax=Streptomyces scabichelini TaxID=2711217 RepID=A0A6G4VBA0_9ACTN|nr:hypothetical protein [Streptomyces scabichelini]NGO11083.1 hypothetical protein [Streptomyces scabichelini]